MHRRLLAERPGGAEQPRVSLVNLRHVRQRIARVEIERVAELFDDSPEVPVLRQVEIDRRSGIVDLREAVHQRADELQFLDAALVFARRPLRVLHRQRREGLKALRAFRDLLRQEIVGLPRHIVSALSIGDRLHGRRIQRQDHDLDPVPIHLAEALAVDVEQPALQLLPHRVGKEAR